MSIDTRSAVIAEIREFIRVQVGYEAGDGMAGQAEELADRLLEGPLRGGASGTPAGYAVVAHYDGVPDPDFVYETVDAARAYVTDMCSHSEAWRVYALHEVSP